MNPYVTGAMIKKLREERKMTQAQLAEKLSVSDKAISKWETGRGCPDIALIEPIANALGVSILELLSGKDVVNRNRACNLKKMSLYVCPVCGNIISSTGSVVVSCCGITLPPLESEAPDEVHTPRIEKVEDEYYVTLRHEMTREHHISFLAALQDNNFELTKLYPEGDAEGRFLIRRTKILYIYCNKHGLFKLTL